MRPWIQGSAAREEDEHPYELLLTAETKKLVSVDRKTKGTSTLPPPPGRNNSKRIFKVGDPKWKEMAMFLGMGKLGFMAV